MTDSGIWWKAATRRPAELMASCMPASASWAALLLLVAIGGLSGCGKAEAPEPSADATSPVQPIEEMPLPRSTSSTSGLTPLLTREQVLSSVPEGRADPFAPTDANSMAGAGQIDPGTAAKDFKVRGVMTVGSELRALVTISQASGTVCVGPRGRCPGDAAALLPMGWSVQSIDLGRGCLSLSVSGQPQRRCIT